MSQPSNKISVVINTYNATQHLRAVLDTVKGFDEVVVCDMESTDDTVAIAQEYGCRIVTFPKANHTCAEPARTFAIQSAFHDWVLVVDADELVTPQLQSYLYEHITHSNAAQGLYIPRRNSFLGRTLKGSWPDYQLRFFIKEGTVWPPHVHTFPEVQGRVDKIPKRLKDCCLIHLSNDNIRGLVSRMNNYTDGEVEKKRDKHYGWGALLWRPVWRFVKAYCLGGLWRDGLQGFISAAYTGFYQFILVSKIIEKRYSQYSKNGSTTSTQ